MQKANSLFRVAAYLPLLSLALLLCCPAKSQAQPGRAIRDIAPLMEADYPLLKDSFSRHKIFAPDYEKQALFALSYFPELKNTRIRFVQRTGHGGIISTRPTVGSIFRRSSRRSYKIFIEEPEPGSQRKFSFRYADVNGQTGIIGHELCHILYFRRHSGIGLLRLALGHLSRKYMDRFEYRTDSVAVERGFGYQLIAWNIFLRKAFGMKNPEQAPDPFTARTGRERYMSIRSIRRVMAASPVYQQAR